MSDRHSNSVFMTRALGAVAGGIVGLILLAPTSAAQDPPDYVGQPAPAVPLPNNNDDPGGVDAGGGKADDGGSGVDAGSGARSADAASGGLPLTGGDILGLTAIGAAAVGTGAVLARRSRHSQRQSATA